MSGPATLEASLNEVETMAAKAARGAGAPWGIAEDLGRAARWRAAHGLPWSEALLNLLAAGPVPVLRPLLRCADEVLGASPGDTWMLGPADLVWAVPLFSDALHGQAVALHLEIGSAAILLAPDGTASASQPWADLPDLAALSMRAELPGPALPFPLPRPPGRQAVPAAEWDRLNAYALNTTVPASAASRATGAGGDRVDAE